MKKSDDTYYMKRTYFATTMLKCTHLLSLYWLPQVTPTLSPFPMLIELLEKKLWLIFFLLALAKILDLQCEAYILANLIEGFKIFDCMPILFQNYLMMQFSDAYGIRTLALFVARVRDLSIAKPIRMKSEPVIKSESAKI